MEIPFFENAATTLSEARRLFDWRNRPRMSDEELERFYEHRTNHRHLKMLLARLKENLTAQTWMHGLYMGASGCGKSTDLTWLVQQIEGDPKLADPLLIRHFNIGEIVGTHEVGFAELALALVLQVYERFSEKNMPRLEDSHLDQVNDWMTIESITESTSRSNGAAISLSALALLRFNLSNRRVREEKVQYKIDQRLPELRQLLGGLFQEVEEKTGKKILFIIDDIEKLSPVEQALGLFLNHGGFFADLECHFLFTAPSALRLEPRYSAEVLNHFKEHRATLARPTPGSDEFRSLQAIVYRRISSALIEHSAVQLAIEKSGGVVAHVIDALERACLTAIALEQPLVNKDDIQEALKEMSARYHAALRDDDYEKLARIHAAGPDGHLEQPGLLHSLAVLEYPDSPTEFALHPLVVPLLLRWQKNRTT